MENEMQHHDSNTEHTSVIQRPWEGTTLYVLSIIGAVFLGMGILGLIAVMLGSSALSGLESSEILAFFVGVGAVMIVPLVLLLVLSIFMARGFAKGQHWTPILSAVLQALSVLGTLANQDFSSLILSAFFLYLSVVCIKHPYYNKS